jgi:hypothetical protein
MPRSHQRAFGLHITLDWCGPAAHAMAAAILSTAAGSVLCVIQPPIRQSVTLLFVKLQALLSH